MISKVHVGAAGGNMDFCKDFFDASSAEKVFAKGFVTQMRYVVGSAAHNGEAGR